MLLADPSKILVQGYAKAGEVVGATVGQNPVGVYVLLDMGNQVMELKNIAVVPELRGQGLGKTLLSHAIKRVGDIGAGQLEVGTGNSSLDQLQFYMKAGFVRERVDKGFFLRNYDEAIYENGLQCTDMIYLSKNI